METLEVLSEIEHMEEVTRADGSVIDVEAVTVLLAGHQPKGQVTVASHCVISLTATAPWSENGPVGGLNTANSRTTVDVGSTCSNDYSFWTKLQEDNGWYRTRDSGSGTATPQGGPITIFLTDTCDNADHEDWRNKTNFTTNYSWIACNS